MKFYVIIIFMRRRCSEKRHINPDRKFNNVLFSKFINKVMLNGKKSIAERISIKRLKAWHVKDILIMIKNVK